MDQTIKCTVLLCPERDVLYVLSDRCAQAAGHRFTYGGRAIEATEGAGAGLPGVPQIPAHWLERLRTQARSENPCLNLALYDEFSGGERVPFERPYFPWDLEPQAESAGAEPGQNELPPF